MTRARAERGEREGHGKDRDRGREGPGGERQALALTLVDDIGQQGVLVLGLDAHAPPAVSGQLLAVEVRVVGVGLREAVSPGEVVVAVAVGQVHLRRRQSPSSGAAGE